MLRAEDCKPGVEIIAIKNIPRGHRKPLLSIGAVYTIEQYKEYCNWDGKRVNIPNVRLHEIPINKHGDYWCYDLECFKLRDPNELIELFDLNNIPNSLRNEVLEDVS